MAVIIIKNSARNVSEGIAEHKYVPQYRLLGITPERANFGGKEENLESKESFKIPNVGNTEDNFWTSSFPEKIKTNSDEDIYFLVAKEKLIMVGALQEVQRELEKIFYHGSEENLPFTIDDVTVLKKMKIKIGIFVE